MELSRTEHDILKMKTITHTRCLPKWVGPPKTTHITTTGDIIIVREERMIKGNPFELIAKFKKIAENRPMHLQAFTLKECKNSDALGCSSVMEAAQHTLSLQKGSASGTDTPKGDA